MQPITLPETVHAADTWEVARRGSLTKSFCGVTDGKGTVYIGVDQPAVAARELTDLRARIAIGDESAAPRAAEPKPYSDFVTKQKANEKTVSSDNGQIDCIVEDEGYAYLAPVNDDFGLYSPYVRLAPLAPLAPPVQAQA